MDSNANKPTRAKDKKRAQRDRERYEKRKASRESATVVEVRASEVPEVVAKIEGMEREYEATLAGKDAEIATLKAAKEQLEKTVERLSRELSAANSRNTSIAGDIDAERMKFKKLSADYRSLEREVENMNRRLDYQVLASTAGWVAFAVLALAVLFF